MRNLDLTALRSFVAVAQSGGVTRAAGFLNLTQSAVSMQIKRLEEALELSLLERSGRGVSLTAAGEKLLVYARRMVDLNDEILKALTDQVFEGEIVLGVPHDIIYPVIPSVLQQFHANYPRVKVQLLSSYTSALRQQYARGDIDVILTTEPEIGPGAETLAEVPLRWVGAPQGTAWRQRPLRLAFCRQCGFRQGALQRLNADGADWELAVDSDSDRTVEATVSADLAVTAMLEGHAPPQLTEINAVGTLPDLGVQKINMYAQKARPEIVEPLLDAMRRGFAALQPKELAVVGR